MIFLYKVLIEIVHVRDMQRKSSKVWLGALKGLIRKLSEDAL